MSTGFRLVLLTLLVFAALWVSRWRARDLAFWLGAPESVQATLETKGSERSPVDGVLPRLVRMEIRSPDVRPEPDRPESEDAAPGRASSGWAALHGGEPATWNDPPPDPVSGHSDGWSGSAEQALEGTDRDETSSGEDTGRVPAPSPPRRDLASERMVELAETPAPPSEEPRTYTVRSGDNLSRIARKLLGKERRYREIVELNQDVLGGSTLIFPGTKLKIPPR